ncbi:asparagine synthase-related protein [Alteriqipengyuania sp. 357]
MFAGVIARRGGDPRDRATGTQLLAAIDPFERADRRGEWQADGALLVQASIWNTPESQGAPVPAICGETGRVLVGWIRLDNRAELLALLGRENGPPLDDAALVLAAHRGWGEACAGQLEGDFAFAIYDPARDSVFCARDALGIKPFFYHLSRDLFVFASSAAVFPILRGFDAAPSREWLARFLIGESADPVKCAYANALKLAPAHALTVEREGLAEPRRYFAFADTAPRADRRDETHVAAYREAFHHAVETRLRSAFPLAVENSGGIDSSTIIGHAVSVLPGEGHDLTAFSLCHMEREAAPILDVAMHCGIRDSYVLTRPDYYPSPDAQARAITVMGYPPEHSHALFHTPFLERCAEAGIRTMLSGFGGDEIVTAHAEFLARELLLDRRFGALVDVMPGALPMRLARAGKRLLDGAQDPGVTAGLSPRVARTLLKREVVEELGLAGFQQGKADAFANARTLGEHLLAKPAFAQMRTGRLEGCTLMAASYGVDYRWPMLDRRLIERYLAIPSIEKRYRRWGRYLHRRACDGTVPDAVLWKETKDLGAIPHLARDWTFEPLAHADLPDRVRDIVDPDALIRQEKDLAAAASDPESWNASRPQRNNLRDLTTLAAWL